MSIYQKRKQFADWLDTNRPWANSNDMYKVIEDITNRAAAVFANDWRPTNLDYDNIKQSILDITSNLEEHPEGYEGECLCKECMLNS